MGEKEWMKFGLQNDDTILAPYKMTQLHIDHTDVQRIVLMLKISDIINYTGIYSEQYYHKLVIHRLTDGASDFQKIRTTSKHPRMLSEHEFNLKGTKYYTIPYTNTKIMYKVQKMLQYCKCCNSNLSCNTQLYILFG